MGICQNELDLNFEIAKRLEPYGKEVVDAWLSHSPINGASHVDSDLIVVNTFLRIQLGSLNVNTVEIRSYLNDSIPVNIWLKGFSEAIAPFLAREGLPAWTKH
ncbi:MAG: hypothetical protein IBX57_01045 [Gammaproteobacteria bacterium]|nr:hypothetical protein [Gammaproteobacteria bacterium]